ncbi:MAG: glycogen synthase GlgA [gamma proteobacterium symbiont of Bathyaustriella thionipta]|nr:glycogen synthase GlgA [gamma proteobacterium symbiont of Bathyaustriella thionipta]
MKILYCVSEIYPLVKTGGLGDVAWSLPRALVRQGLDVRLLLPAYREVLRQVENVRILGWLAIDGPGGPREVRILQASPKGFSMPLWLVDCAELFDRPGNPYLGPDGHDWPDNAQRYACFSRVAAKLGVDALQLDWRPDVVHSHDWQTGLVSAFLTLEANPPRSIFTVHNLAYGGHFSYEEFQNLQLPGNWWDTDAMEFYFGFSMLKAGLTFSDAITTVSPTYAREIATPQFGYGMDGILAANPHKLYGILNGVDEETWNPEADPYLKAHYSAKRRNPGKRKNKRTLLKKLGCKNADTQQDKPLFGMVSRLVEQKGVDMVIEAIPPMLEYNDICFAIIGSGDPQLESQLQELAEKYPDQVMLFIGYSEKLAHLLEAGADYFLMPSRFEPCGLNQLYSLRYGTLPIVHHVGGLADTVTDANEENLLNNTATGFVFHHPGSSALIETMQRALSLYHHPRYWNQLQRNAMQQDFSWKQSAERYRLLYADKNP